RSGKAARIRRRKLGILGFQPYPPSRPWTPAEHQLLGTLPDSQLAAQLGRSWWAVAKRRFRYQVPPFGPKFKPWPPAHLRLLGKIADAEVSLRSGRSKTAVQTKRRKLGIPVLRDPL